MWKHSTKPSALLRNRGQLALQLSRNRPRSARAIFSCQATYASEARSPPGLRIERLLHAHRGARTSTDTASLRIIIENEAHRHTPYRSRARPDRYAGAGPAIVRARIRLVTRRPGPRAGLSRTGPKRISKCCPGHRPLARPERRSAMPDARGPWARASLRQLRPGPIWPAASTSDQARPGPLHLMSGLVGGLGQGNQAGRPVRTRQRS